MKNKISQKTHDRLHTQLRQLQHELINVMIPEVAAARDHSNNEENDQLMHAKQQQQNLETRINTLLKFLKSADVVTHVKFTGKVIYGTLVTMTNDDTDETKTFKLVGEMESTEPNDVSIRSPMGLAIAGNQVGDSIEIDLPNGSQAWTIVEIKLDDQFA